MSVSGTSKLSIPSQATMEGQVCPTKITNTTEAATQPAPDLPPTTAATPGPSNLPSIPEQCKHKNRLQEYTQRSSLPLPIYHTANEGPPHAPKFISTVVVDGVSYKSAHSFIHRKEAEQEVAKLALEKVLRKVKDEGCPLIRQDTTFCKSILNEFAVKTGVEMPTYTTNLSEGKLPLFISTLVFHGKAYKGAAGRNKKEAEQLGARAVIESVLGTVQGMLMSQIIKSKSNLYAALHDVNDYNTPEIIPSLEDITQVENVSQPDPLVSGFKKPKLEHECGTSTLLIGNGAQALDVSPCVTQPEPTGSETATATATGSIIGKKRKKNKSKGRKKIRVSERSEAQPIIQAASCSVAQ